MRQINEEYILIYDIPFTCSHFSVNACLAPLCSVDHMAVTTVEGIGSTRTKIHPVQVCMCSIEYTL